MKRPADFDCVLGGKRWRIHFVRRNHPKIGKKCWGRCYRFDQEIYVRYDLSEKNFLDTLIHECQHALSDLHFCAEEWVAETSTEISVALLKSGLVSSVHRKT